MKKILKQIIPSLWLVMFFGFPSAASAQVLRTNHIQQINSGLFRSNSQDFLLQGNRQLEQEIRILLEQLLNSQGEILELDQKLRSKVCHKKFKISLRNFDTINVVEITRVYTKVKHICSQN